MQMPSPTPNLPPKHPNLGLVTPTLLLLPGLTSCTRRWRNSGNGSVPAARPCPCVMVPCIHPSWLWGNYLGDFQALAGLELLQPYLSEKGEHGGPSEAALSLLASAVLVAVAVLKAFNGGYGDPRRNATRSGHTHSFLPQSEHSLPGWGPRTPLMLSPASLFCLFGT